LLDYLAGFKSFISGGKTMMNRARVLVVDDEPLVRQTLSEWLRRKHFHVLEAEGGRQAMERIRREAPDIVISDVVMPGMDGIELLKEAKSLKADIPFLMVTGYPSHHTAVEVMQLGAADYLVKPFKPEELSRRVGRTLLESSLDKSLCPVKGMILAASLSTILWALIIGALSAFFA
jgi:DNA-binding NtrC family response regulator